MNLRTFFALGFLVSGAVLVGLWLYACEDRSADVGEIVKLLRLEGYGKDTIEPDSQLALLVLKRKELAKKLLDASRLHERRKKDLAKSQNEMFAALAKTKYSAEEARKQFESGKVFSINEPLGNAYHKWKETQTAAEGLARINIWMDKQSKEAPLYEFTGKIKMLIYNWEEGELLHVSPEEQKEIDRLLATQTKEPTLTSADVVEPEKVQDLIWEQQGKEDVAAENTDFPATEGVDRNLLEQYAGMENHATEPTALSGGNVTAYVIRPKWFRKAFFTDAIVLVGCLMGFIFSARRRKAHDARISEEKERQARIEQEERARKEREERNRDEKERNEKEKEKKRKNEQVRAKTEMFGELLVLFSESEDFHRSGNATMYDQLISSRNRLVEFPFSQRDLTVDRNVAAVLEIIDELHRWWKDYSAQNDVRFLQFWRPDSWVRFESAFPNQRITGELREFSINQS